MDDNNPGVEVLQKILDDLKNNKIRLVEISLENEVYDLETPSEDGTRQRGLTGIKYLRLEWFDQRSTT